jgi:flagellar motor switch/type III secretory pathway protein FliN
MTASRIARPFPWRSVEATTRVQEDALRDARRWASRYVELTALGRAMAELAHAKVEVLVRRARLLEEAGGFGEGLGVALSSAEHPANPPLALVQVERALATELVARAIRRPPPAVVDTAAARSSALAGAFAALLIAGARRSHGSITLRVSAAGEASALEAEFSLRPRDTTAITLTVLVGDNAYAARALLARSLLAAAPPFAFRRADLLGLGTMPLSMPVVACAVTLSATDVAALRSGDVAIPGAFPLVRSADGTWIGPVLLSPPDGATAVRADLGEGGRLVLRGDVVPLDAAEEDMDPSDASPAIIEAVGEIPVVVRVEIGQARMLAREWASLACGDVVALGQRIGERVVLRVGGVVVARGELVDLDGEVGVRIVERVAEEHVGA